MYKGSGDVLADGSDAADVAAWELKQRADAAAGPASTSADLDTDGEDDLDAALEATLDRLAGSGGDEMLDDFADDFEDGFVDSSDSDDAPRERAARPARLLGARAANGSSSAPAAVAQPDSFSKVCLTLCA